MDWLTQALSGQRELLWFLLAIAAVALLLRALKPAEQRSLRLTWVLLLLALLCLAAAALSGERALVGSMMGGAAVVLAGLAAIQLGVAIVYRGVLPAFGAAAPRIAQDISFTALSLGWGLLWLRLSGVDPSQLFTTSALVTAVLAFAMQDTLGNVLGGVVIQLDDSLRVGDWVRMDDINGRVGDVRWRYTVIETRNREQVMVPNSWLMKNRFYVVRAPEDGGPLASRRAVTLLVEAQADPAAVIQALERAVLDADIPHALADPPPSAILAELASGHCRYVLRYWLADMRFDDPTDSAVRVHALAALSRAGIRLGLHQEEHLMIKEDESWRAAEQAREAARRLQAIQRTDLFAALPLMEQQALAGHLVHAPFVAGDTMTRQGAVAHWLYLIVRGEARVYVNTPPAGRVEVATLQDGSVFGEMGMLTGEPRSATVVAATTVECYRLDKVGFAQVLQARPEIAREISAIVEARSAERNARLAQAGQRPVPHGDVLERILSFFALGD